MAIFKVVISTVQVTTGIVEANSKEEITAELEKNNPPEWWAVHTSTTESITATTLEELEEKSG